MASTEIFGLGTPEAVFQAALETFKSGLTAAQLESFPKQSLNNVKLKIRAIQQRQERLKTLMNFSRIQFYLDRFAEFDAVCQRANIAGQGTAELSAFIWGPSLFILEISEEDANVLDSVLDTYQKFGKRIPDPRAYDNLVQQRPEMMKCIAFMYEDLLRFYASVLKLLSGRIWKKTFGANWQDFLDSFSHILESFDNHGKLLEQLLAARERHAVDDARQRLNDHIIRSAGDGLVMRDYANNYEADRMVLLRGAESVRAMDSRLNDHIIRSGDDGLVMRSHANDYDADRAALLRGAGAAQAVEGRLNDHIIRHADDSLIMRDLASEYDRDRTVLLQGAESSEAADRRLNGHVTRSNDFYHKVQRHIDQYEQDRIELLRKSRHQEKTRKEEQLANVKHWMSSPGVPQSEYHSQFRSVRHDFQDTGIWILDEPKLLNWMMARDEPPVYSMLWLNGRKGAGKTTLAALIVDKCDQMLDFSTSYFYCREGDTGDNTCLAVLKGILRQFVQHNQDLLPSCEQRRTRGEEILNDPATVRSLLDLFCDHDSNHFVIIDGLDECDISEAKAIADFWTTAVDRCDRYKPGKLRVLFVSVHTPDIRKMMQSADILDLPPGKSGKDIWRYVAKQFGRIQDKFELTEDESLSAQELVCQRADGMFLFAVLTVQNLLEQPNLRTLKAELKETSLPATLEEAYRKVIERLRQNLHPNQWAEARKIFGWLAGAKRPLKWHELQAALSIEVDDVGRGALDYRHNRLRLEIREICGSLVQVLQNRIEFIHSTTRSYILMSEHLDEKAIECDLTILCLSYLTFDCFKQGLDAENRKKFASDGYYSFQDYAISKLNYHVEKLIRTTPSLFGQVGNSRGRGYDGKLAAVLTRFLEFYRESFVAAAAARPPSLSQLASLRARSPPQSGSSTQRSASPSRSPTPLSQQHQQGVNPVEFCQQFQHTSFHSQLQELWAHVYSHQSGDLTERNKISLPDLEKAMDKARSKIVELAANSSREKLAEYYGDRLHKCSRLTCSYFYEGFETEARLDKHLKRHDRPFQCPVNGCMVATLGFSANKDLEKHLRQAHPNESGQPSQFVGDSKPTLAEPKWVCEICNKRFVRQAIKKAHVNSHYGTRPHACETCGKKFTRANDRNRHRKLHMRAPNGRER
ncbi:hypothetical protein B0T26DRAFT_861233 [Lasiosphaeria miniovina]|uniref:C2H2-type domain-containing protein n=1 Tax=Lasiosphaeria miniovina TaxID=1954250 RepID=A0AA40A638_9PEZI|nr:uncharacterized protein B0T26DRAFT_861233 [Lasiosphaeria miniovina]KAK0710004.1 hypothetical protein B0T26DRAFT_861233 [Lasiosphaeria miniovina]